MSLTIEALGLPNLDPIERGLLEATQSDLPVMQEMAQHLLHGGKRVRPTLVILSAALFGADPEAPVVLDVAIACELIHTASLIHDDIIDKASHRRQRVSVNQKWGNHLAVLAGDFLFSRAFALLSRHRRDNVTSVLTRAIGHMCEGQVEQVTTAHSLEQGEAGYFRQIRGKTAELLAASCEAGSMLATTDQKAARAMRTYGLQVGYAFQIVDDILDFEADPKELGKPVGLDLESGVVTLPLLRAAQDKYWGPHIRQALAKGEEIGAELGTLQQAVHNSGALEYARRQAMHHVNLAYRALEEVPANQWTQTLASLASLTLARKV